MEGGNEPASGIDVLRQELREATEREAAIGEILRAISGSRADVQPVLDAIAENAARVCGASDAHVYRVDGDRLLQAAHVGPIPGLEPSESLPLDRGSLIGRSIIDRHAIHIRDAATDLDPSDYPISAQLQRRWGYRTSLSVPLLGEDSAIGGIAIRRTEVRPFTTKQIELLETFAAQAVIAIENVRLFKETNAALARQTATSEVLQSISRTVFDLDAVLTTVLENAMRLCDSTFAGLYRREGDSFHLAVSRGVPPEWVRDARENPPDVHGGGVLARVTAQKRPVHIDDVLADADYVYKDSARSGGFRTLLGVPLSHNDEVIGVLSLARDTVRPYVASEIELVRTFADQAAIAIENVRLFSETKDALDRQTALGEILRVIAASPSDISPVLDAIAESAARFCVAEDATVAIRGEDGLLRIRAHVGPLDATIPPWPVDATTVSGRSLVEARTIQVADLQAAGDEYPLGQAQAFVLQERTTLAAPFIRDGRGIGVLFLRRAEVRPFSDKQVELVKVFADQAVIAIENVRLITEIQAKSAELESANRELATASRHKSEFLANMSHELRTPLNAIIGFSDVLEQRLFGDLNERQSEYTRDIASSGRHLLDLVNEILDLSKVEAGRMDLEQTEFALGDTIHSALAFVRERATGHSIDLGAEVPADLGTVVADERKVRQVLLNLLSNAVKFTPDGGTIGVRARRARGAVEVSVRDTGIGIAPEDQSKVFDEFQQVGKASDRSREGTGLGLTLAKRFIELHGGRIWVESEVGKGTTFTFAIPLGGAAAAPA